MVSTFARSFHREDIVTALSPYTFLRDIPLAVRHWPGTDNRRTADHGEHFTNSFLAIRT